MSNNAISRSDPERYPTAFKELALISSRFTNTSFKQTNTKLPLELIDLIIDHSHSDRHALCTFSLVCRDWVSSSRYHLLSTLRLNEIGTLGLPELLDSPETTFLPQYVRGIIFTFKSKSQTPALGSAVYRLRFLPHVSFMVVSFKRFTYLTAVAPNITKLRFETLTHLELSKVYFEKFTEFTTFLCSFQFLRSLVLRTSWDTEQELPPPDLYRPSALLRSLEVECGIEHILEWFLSLDPVPTLSSLSLHLIVPDYVPHIVRYLSTLGPTLEDLRLEFVNVELPTFFESLDLGIYTKLRSLHLDEVPDCAPRFFTILPKILLQIQSEEMEEIALVILSESLRDLDALPWAGIEQALEHPQFSQLQFFRIRLLGGDLDRMAKEMEYIRMMLPVVADKGIFQFETELESDYVLRRGYS